MDTGCGARFTGESYDVKSYVLFSGKAVIVICKKSSTRIKKLQTFFHLMQMDAV